VRAIWKDDWGTFRIAVDLLSNEAVGVFRNASQFVQRRLRPQVIGRPSLF